MQLENLITVPMDTFQKTELDNVREKRKKFEKTSQGYDGALSKVSQIKKRTTIRTIEVFSLVLLKSFTFESK